MISKSRFPILGLIPSIIGSVIVFALSTSAIRESSEAADVLSNEEKEIVPEEGKTFRELLTAADYKPIEHSTSDEVIKNILVGRMFPHYKSQHKLKANFLFDGSPEITLEGQELISNNKKVFILNKNSKEDANSLKMACIVALGKSSKKYADQLPKLREWCTAPTVKDVLKRHKFRIAGSDTTFKTILNSDWFKDENIGKQSFITKEELVGSEAEKIKTLRNKCVQALKKSFERSNFPATTDFLKSIQNGDRGQKADEFQEAALFCTVPKTAEEYVSTAMQGSTFETTQGWQQYDYCAYNNEKIDYYKNIKTTDPMGGKSFWCAVKMIYEKFKAKPSNE